jgi:hypothetical protein
MVMPVFMLSFGNVELLLTEADDMDSSSPSGCHNAPSELMGKRGVHVITLEPKPPVVE